MPTNKAVWILLLVAGALAGAFRPSQAQSTGRVRIEENFRREPNGVVLARVTPGAQVRVVGREGNWTEVELSGFVWLPSLQVADDATFDLVVALEGGENLRAEPAGPIVARLEEGALLTEVGRNPSWAEVTRTGWVWSLSLDEDAPAAEAPTRTPSTTEPSGARPPGGFATLGSSGGAILTAPDGDTLALASPSSDLQVLAREGSWARVRVEGWIWMPAAAGAVEQPQGPSAAIEPSELSEDPGAFNGRVVTWPLQFISLERAEAVRTDFFEGEPFLLTRYGAADGPFVYVALAPERLEEVEGLVPLERVTVTARVRTGASALTGTPIVDLLSIERSREAP